jgi:hypothetical protein
LDWNPQGKRRRGGPRHTWRRTVHSEALEKGKSRSEVKRMAGNTRRTRWRRFVDTLCPLGNNRNWWWWCAELKSNWRERDSRFLRQLDLTESDLRKQYSSKGLLQALKLQFGTTVTCVFRICGK